MDKKELKVLGWDALSNIQFWQGQLNLINKKLEEISEKEKADKTPPPPAPETLPPAETPAETEEETKPEVTE